MLGFWLLFSWWLVFALANPSLPPYESVDSASKALSDLESPGTPNDFVSSSGSHSEIVRSNLFQYHDIPAPPSYLAPQRVVVRAVIPEDPMSETDSSFAMSLPTIPAALPVYSSIFPLLSYSTIFVIIAFFSIRIARWRNRRNRRGVELDGVELLPTTTANISPRFRDSPLPPPLPERPQSASPIPSHAFSSHSRSHSVSNLIRLAGDPERPKSPINLGLSSPGSRRSKRSRSFGESSRRYDSSLPTPLRRPFASEPEPDIHTKDPDRPTVIRPYPHSTPTTPFPPPTLFGTLIDLSTSSASANFSLPSPDKGKNLLKDVSLHRTYSTDDNPFAEQTRSLSPQPRSMVMMKPEAGTILEPTRLHNLQQRVEEAMLIDFSPRLRPQSDADALTFPASVLDQVTANRVLEPSSTREQDTNEVEDEGKDKDKEGYESDQEDSAEKDTQQEIDIGWSWGFDSVSSASTRSDVSGKLVVSVPSKNREDDVVDSKLSAMDSDLVEVHPIGIESSTSPVREIEISTAGSPIEYGGEVSLLSPSKDEDDSFNRGDTTLESDLIQRVHEDESEARLRVDGQCFQRVLGEQEPPVELVPIPIVVLDHTPVSKEWPVSFTPSPGSSPIMVPIADLPPTSSEHEKSPGPAGEQVSGANEQNEKINDFNDRDEKHDIILIGDDAPLQSHTSDVGQGEGIHSLGVVRVVVTPDVIPLPVSESSSPGYGFEEKEKEAEAVEELEDGVAELTVPFQPFSPPPSHDDFPIIPNTDGKEEQEDEEEFPDPDDLPLPDLLPPVSEFKLSTLPLLEVPEKDKELSSPSSLSSVSNSPTQIPTPPASPPSSPALPRRQLLRERERDRETLSPASSSPVSTARPAWSLRAADAPALGIPSPLLSSKVEEKKGKEKEKENGEENAEKEKEEERPSKELLTPSTPTPKVTSPIPTFGVTRSTSLPGSFPVDVHPLSESTNESTSASASESQTSKTNATTFASDSSSKALAPATKRIRVTRSPIDIALAMQLRPGLGVGADPAWMVRFLMAMFGWFVVLISGTGGYESVTPYVGMRRTR